MTEKPFSISLNTLLQRIARDADREMDAAIRAEAEEVDAVQADPERRIFILPDPDNEEQQELD